MHHYRNQRITSLLSNSGVHQIYFHTLLKKSMRRNMAVICTNSQATFICVNLHLQFTYGHLR